MGCWAAYELLLLLQQAGETCYMFCLHLCCAHNSLMMGEDSKRVAQCVTALTRSRQDILAVVEQ
jgi:hypothetical protein